MEYKIINLKTEKLEDRIIRFMGTDDSKDRDNEILTSDGWNIENYSKNPVFLWAHNYSSPPIGKTMQIIRKDKQMYFDVKFAEKEIYEFADTIYKLYKEGYLKAVSVGFNPDNSKRVYDPNTNTLITPQKELLELSGCPVGANQNALITEDEIKSAVKKNVLSQKESENYLEAMKKYIKTDKEEIEIKPYPNEHSCRLKSPEGFDSFARKNCYAKKVGKCIDYIFGIKEGKSEVQAMRFDKDVWSEDEAKDYCKEKEGTFEAAKQIDKIEYEKGYKISDSLYKEILSIKVTKSEKDKLDNSLIDNFKNIKIKKGE